MASIIRRTKEEKEQKTQKEWSHLTDEQKYQTLLQFSEGVPIVQIAEQFDKHNKSIEYFITKMIHNLNGIKETNLLAKGNNVPDRDLYVPRDSKFINKEFKERIQAGSHLDYAEYYAQTGDNKFALDNSGLNCGVRKTKKITRDYILRVRGQYLRDMPEVASIIKAEQDKRIREYHLEKPQVQMELVTQIEEMKELVIDDPKQRPTLLKAVELLGKTIGAFTDRVEVEETDAKSGLTMLMERAQKEIKGGTYTVEDLDG